MKDTGRFGWVSLSSIQNRKIFESYSSSWKGFKPEFFKIVSQEEGRPFFLDHLGRPKFPLFWPQEPRIIKRCDYDFLSSREKLEVDFLEQLVEVSCLELIDSEDDISKLTDYMGRMASKMSKQVMLEILEQKKKTVEIVASEARQVRGKTVVTIKDQSNRVGCDRPLVKHPSKDTRCDDRVNSKRRTGNDLSSSESVFEQLLSSQANLSPDVASLWNPQFLLGLPPSPRLQYQADAELYGSLPRSQVAKMSTLLSLRSTSLSHYAEVDFSLMEAKLIDLEDENSHLK